MHIKKIATALLMFTLGGAALAASSTTAPASNTSSFSFSKIRQKLKESPLSFSLLSDNYSGKSEKTKYMDEMVSANYTFLGYKITPQDKLTLTNLWVTDRVKAKDGKSFSSHTTYNRIQLSYSRYGILNAQDHGINLSAAIAFRIHPDTKYRNDKNRNGQQSISFTGSRSFANGLSVSTYSTFVKRNVRMKDKSHTRSYLRQIITPSYSFTKKLSASLQFDYLHYFTKTTNKGSTLPLKKEIDLVDVQPAIQYAFSPRVTGEIYAVFSPLASYDGRILQKNWAKYPTIGADFSISAF